MLLNPEAVASEGGLRADRRFTRWARVTRPEEIDLNQTGAYALGGRFVRYDAPVVLDDGEYLVVYAETGTRRYRSGRVIVAAVRDGTVRIVDRNAIRQAAKHPGLPDTVAEKAARNPAYAAAVYIHVAERLRG